jgi:hypothetical protein
MAKARAGRLKVFQAQFGFHDTVLAVPSQAQALRVWGTRQNLFAEGQAKPAQDPDAIAAALAHPGVLLKRPAGSDAAFKADSAALPRVPERRKRPADRTKLTAAEAALRKLAAMRERQEAALRRRQEKLEAEIAKAQAAYDAARKAATAAVVAAQQAYRKAGGEA